MYILTSISVNSSRVRVFDTSDGTNDELDLRTVVDNMDKFGMRIFGIRPVSPNTYLPPDARLIPALGVAIVPSESREAMISFRNGNGR